MRTRTASYRHTLATRVTHATFSIAFFGLIATGVQMYLRQHWLPINVAALHQDFGLAMIASGFVYFAGSLLNGTLRKLLFRAQDVRGLFPMVAYYLRLRKDAPQFDSEYNPLQKLAYTLVLLTLGPMMAATGIAMWPHLAIVRPVLRMAGGRNAVTIWHLGFAVELVLFFAGHMVMVATTGLRRNLSAIVTGWYRRPAVAQEIRATDVAA